MSEQAKRGVSHGDAFPRGRSRLELVPVTRLEARRFVAEHHRHALPPSVCVFQLGVARNGRLCGVALVGRPVARMLCDGVTCEVLRCCTDGERNACSMLYGASARAARALGYRRIVTYTLERERGASLRGAGWTCDGAAGDPKAPQSWQRQRGQRGRTMDLFGRELVPSGPKLRWSRTL